MVSKVPGPVKGTGRLAAFDSKQMPYFVFGEEISFARNISQIRSDAPS